MDTELIEGVLNKSKHFLLHPVWPMLGDAAQGVLSWLSSKKLMGTLCRRNEIELCSRLLGVAAVGLNQNPALVFFVLVSKIALSILTLPMYGLMFVAYTNGKIVPNSKSLRL